MDPDRTERTYVPSDRDVRRELVFSVVLLFLYPAPILWACFTLVSDVGSSVMPLFLGLTFAAEVLSAVERTLLLRGLERTVVRLGPGRIEKDVAGRRESLALDRLAFAGVRRSLLGGRPVAALLVSLDGDRLYLPGFQDLGALLGDLEARVGHGRIRTLRAGRLLFPGAFLAFLGLCVAALAGGVLSARLVAVLVLLSAVAVLLRHPFHRLLGRSFRSFDRALAATTGALGLAAFGFVLAGFLARRASLASAEELIAGGPAVRHQGVQALARIGGERAWLRLRDLSYRPEPALRREAVLALAGLSHPQAVRRLRKALHDDDPVVRRYAAFGLGCQGQPSHIPSLIAVLKRTDEEPEVLEAANHSLERLTSQSFLRNLSWSRLEEPERRLLVDFWIHVWRETHAPGAGDGASR